MKLFKIGFASMIGAGLVSIASSTMSAQTSSQPSVLKSINYTESVTDFTTNEIVPIHNNKGMWGFERIGGSSIGSNGKRHEMQKKTVIKPQYEDLGMPFVYTVEKELLVDKDTWRGKKKVMDETWMVPVKKAGKWGLVAIDTEIVKPEFDEIGELVQMAKKDASGEYIVSTVIPAKLNGNSVWLSPQGTPVDDPGDLEVGYRAGLMIVEDNGKLAVIDDYWDDIDVSGEKRFRLHKRGGGWYRFIYPEKKLVEEFSSDGWVKIPCRDEHKNETYVYIKTDENGDVDKSAVTFTNSDIIKSGEDYLVKFTKDGFKGLMEKGKVILEPEYSEISPIYDVRDWYMLSKKDSKKVYDNVNKRMVIDGPYSEISLYSESNSTKWVAAVKKNGKWGFINQTGKEIIPCQYLSLRNFDGRTLAESSDGTSALIKVWASSGEAEVLIPAGVFDKIENLSYQPFYTLSRGNLLGAYFPSTKTYVAPKFQHLDSNISDYVILWNGSANPVRGLLTAYNMKGKAAFRANIQNKAQLKAFVDKLLFSH